jgi:hypothetical protein
MDEKTNTAIPREKQVLGLAVANTAISGPGERVPAVPRLADGESRNVFCPGELSKVVALQCRLLAARAEAGLPLDVRSLRNLIRISRDLIQLSAAA